MSQSDIELHTLSASVSQAPSHQGTDSESKADVADSNLVPPTNKEQFDSYPEDATAWMQVAAGATLFGTSVGGIYTWGVFADALVTAGVGDSNTVAWIGSTQASLQAILSILVGRLVARYGARNCAIVGSVLLGLGPLLGSFCTTSLVGLALTEGIIFGLGESLLFFASAVGPSSYFLRRRNLATGLSYSGGGIGGAILSISVGKMLERFSIAWTFRIFALILTGVSLPAAFVLKSRMPRQPFHRATNGRDPNSSLFNDASFCFLLAGTAIGVFPLFVPPFFLPLYGTALGLSKATSSYLLAGYNLASAAGRIVFGVFADQRLGSLNSLILCLGFVSISMWAIWPFATSIPPLVIFAVVNGFCAGGMFSLIPGTVSSLFGSTRLTVVFTLLLTFWTPAYFFGSPIAGYLLQASGGPDGGIENFRSAIFYAAGLSTLSTGLVAGPKIIEVVKRRRSSNVA
ncbi:uncharacterized protein JCM15063_004733 [Sporobolomyces koalae]|uniref:uncharacterized protein n=1 Tax=Sporobolomyces koalae TaxID=500713 RepID=UPI003181888A